MNKGSDYSRRYLRWYHRNPYQPLALVEAVSLQEALPSPPQNPQPGRVSQRVAAGTLSISDIFFPIGTDESNPDAKSLCVRPITCMDSRESGEARALQPARRSRAGKVALLAALNPCGDPLSAGLRNVPVSRSSSGGESASGGRTSLRSMSLSSGIGAAPYSSSVTSTSMALTTTLNNPSLCDTLSHGTAASPHSRSRIASAELDLHSPMLTLASASPATSCSFLPAPTCVSVASPVQACEMLLTPTTAVSDVENAALTCVALQELRPSESHHTVHHDTNSPRQRPAKSATSVGIHPTPPSYCSASDEVAVEVATTACPASQDAFGPGSGSSRMSNFAGSTATPQAMSAFPPRPSNAQEQPESVLQPVEEAQEALEDSQQLQKSQNRRKRRSAKPSTSVHDDAFANHYKTRLCTNYMEEGRCKYGRICRFAHGRGDLRTYGMNMRAGITSVEALLEILRGRLGEKKST